MTNIVRFAFSVHNIIQPSRLVLDLGICQLYFMPPPKRIFVYDSYNQVTLGNFGGLMLPALSIGTLFIPV